MKLGIHAYVWCSLWSNETLDLIDKVSDFGMDFIEIPLMRLDLFDAEAVKDRLDRVGLKAVTSTVLLGDTDITSDDENIRRKGTQYLKDYVKATSDIGAGSFSGVIYSQHVKQAVRRPGEDDWRRSAECLNEVAVYALQGVRRTDTLPPASPCLVNHYD